MLGSAVCPHPYTIIVKEFQKVIGEEARKQILDKEGRLSDYAIVCVGGGSNAIDLFRAFLNDKEVKLVGVEAAGYGIDTDMHAATITKGEVDVIHGMRTLVLKDSKGEIKDGATIGKILVK